MDLGKKHAAASENRTPSPAQHDILFRKPLDVSFLPRDFSSTTMEQLHAPLPFSEVVKVTKKDTVQYDVHVSDTLCFGQSNLNPLCPHRRDNRSFTKA